MSIECEEFYNLMQAYRWAGDGFPKAPGLPTAAEAYQAVISYIDRYVGDELINRSEDNK